MASVFPVACLCWLERGHAECKRRSRRRRPRRPCSCFMQNLIWKSNDIRWSVNFWILLCMIYIQRVFVCVRGVRREPRRRRDNARMRHRHPPERTRVFTHQPMERERQIIFIFGTVGTRAIKYVVAGTTTTIAFTRACATRRRLAATAFIGRLGHRVVMSGDGGIGGGGVDNVVAPMSSMWRRYTRGFIIHKHIVHASVWNCVYTYIYISTNHIRYRARFVRVSHTCAAWKS